MRQILVFFFHRLFQWADAFLINTLPGNKLMQYLGNSSMKIYNSINYNNQTYHFCVPNRLCKYRVDTFSTKEVETLIWIENIPKGSVIWDVGANIGLYSIYAAKNQSCIVYAFEPSVFNLEILARNIFLNKLQTRITIIPFALSDQLGLNTFKMTNTVWGGALSTFGKNFGSDGKTLESVFEFKIIGLSMDYALTNLLIPQPDFIKIDVDGIEHIILQGSTSVLKNVKSLLVEVNDDFIDQAKQCKEILNKAGFELKEKKNSEMIHQTNIYNQIWVKKQINIR